MASCINLMRSEQMVMERRYHSILPTLLIALGVIGIAFGFIAMISTELPLFLAGIPFLIVGAILRANSEIRLVVTTKRVFVYGPFGRFNSLPLEHITTVQGGNGGLLHIGAPGAAIQLSGVEDNMVICSVIVDLLNVGVHRGVPAAPAPAHHAPRTNPTSAPAPAHQAPRQNPAPAPTRKAQPVKEETEEYWVCAACDTKNMKGRATCWFCGDAYVAQVAKPVVSPAAPVEDICPDCTCKLEETTINGVKTCPHCGRMFG